MDTETQRLSFSTGSVSHNAALPPHGWQWYKRGTNYHNIIVRTAVPGFLETQQLMIFFLPLKNLEKPKTWENMCKLMSNPIEIVNIHKLCI